MKRKLLLAFALGCITIASHAQTVTFKPGPAIGEDASVFMTDFGCIFTGDTVPPENTNYPNGDELGMIDWTYNAIGCPDGTIRSLIRFSQLSSIPPSATIVSATLRFHGVASSASVPGNTAYTGTPYTPGDNRVYISRVTSPWTETGVTWNTQPTTLAPAITTTVSATQWNWNYSNSSPALLAMVQDMVTNPSTNLGFQLRLENETNYRSMLFASSDHPDSTLWPELTVTYTVCNPNFSFCSNANNPYVYTFAATDPTGAHLWKVNGVAVGGAPTLVYTFGVGTFDVCHTYTDPVKGSCTRCFRLCIPQNSIYMMAAEQPNDNNMETINNSTATRVPQRSMVSGDLNLPGIGTNKQPEVVPNPTNNNWDVAISSDQAATAVVKLKTIDGKTVFTKRYELNTGRNTISIPGANLPAAAYFLEINQNSQTRQLKLLKN